MISDSLFSYQIGKGPELIILHGLFGSGDNWGSIARRLSEHFSVHLLDLRNHGQSFHAETMTYLDMATDVDRYLKEKNISSAYLVGHSMGGKVAMQLGMSFPNRVKKLVVLDIAPKSYDLDRHSAILAALNGLNLSQFTSRQDIDAALATQIEDRAMRLFLLKNIQRDPSNHFKWQLNLATITDQYPEISAPPHPMVKVTIPTLFIRGANSSYIEPDDISLFETWFSNYQLVTFEDAGHWLNAEKPNDLVEWIVKWMR